MSECVVYSRISTPNQTSGYSIESQINICSKYAKNNNFNIKGYYSDIGSGKKMKNLTELNNIINNYGNITLLVCNIDRFSRNLEEACNYLKKLDSKNIILYSVEQDVSNKNISSTRLLKSYINDSEFESNLIGLRVKKSINSIKKKGGYVGGVKFGYERKRVKKIPIIVKNKKEFDIINIIVNLRLGISSSEKLSNQIYKLTNINVPLKFFDKNDNQINHFKKPFTLTFKEIADILNDYKITIRNKKCTRSNVNTVFKKNCSKNKINKIKKSQININTLTQNMKNISM